MKIWQPSVLTSWELSSLYCCKYSHTLTTWIIPAPCCRQLKTSMTFALFTIAHFNRAGVTLIPSAFAAESKGVFRSYTVHRVCQWKRYKCWHSNSCFASTTRCTDRTKTSSIFSYTRNGANQTFPSSGLSTLPIKDTCCVYKNWTHALWNMNKKNRRILETSLPQTIWRLLIWKSTIAAIASTSVHISVDWKSAHLELCRLRTLVNGWYFVVVCRWYVSLRRWRTRCIPQIVKQHTQ